MTDKRKRPSSLDSKSDGTYRVRKSTRRRDNPSAAYIDPTTGQRSVFPALDDTDSLADGEGDVYAEAMAYLQGVR